MRSEEEINEMSARFEEAELKIIRGEDPNDTAVDGVLDCLAWIMGEIDDDGLLNYIPKDVK